MEFGLFTEFSCAAGMSETLAFDNAMTEMTQAEALFQQGHKSLGRGARCGRVEGMRDERIQPEVGDEVRALVGSR